jgi:outer membrane murein-binding lipoprotein Lpp
MRFIRVGVISGVLVSSNKVGKEDSLSVLQRAGIAMNVDAGSQLEATKKLQDTLGDTIMQSITNSDPDAMARISDDFVKVLGDQMTAIKAAVSAENSELQTAVSDAGNVVVNCNSAKQTSFDSGATSVNHLNWKVHQLREDHIQCRTQEVAAVDDAVKECESAQGVAQTAAFNQPSCSCGADNSDKKAALACFGSTDQWILDDLEPLEAAEAMCVTKEQTKKDTSGLCNRNQTNFESSFCAYSIKLGAVCDTLATCHANALAAYNGIEGRGKLQEVSHKELWTAVTRVDCLIKLFSKAKTENLKENDVNGCLKVSVVTSDLDIIYPGADSKEPCDTSTTIWNRTEYTTLNQTHIQALEGCVVDTMTPEIDPAPPLKGACTPDPEGTVCNQLEDGGTWDSDDVAVFYQCLADNCIDQTKIFDGYTCDEIIHGEGWECDDIVPNYGKVADLCPRSCNEKCRQC